MDPIGHSLKISPLSSSISKLEADIIIAFQQDPREFLLIMNSNMSLLLHRRRLINQHLWIYSKALIPIQFLMAEEVPAHGLATFVLER